MLSRFRVWLTLGIVLLVLTGCSLSLPFVTKKAGLQISSTPQATVFLDGQHVGQTPYDTNDLKAGEVSVKLVPEGISGVSWESKIKLTPKVVSVIERNFGPTSDQSSGAVFTLEPLTKKTTAALVILATPDNSTVSVDNEPQGFSPASLDPITPGEHNLGVSSPGFSDRSFQANVPAGYKLVADVQLARIPAQAETPVTPAATPSAALPSPTPIASSGVASASASAKAPPYVEILANPLGFLRVRAEPSTSATEVARAYPGQKLPYQNEENNGWYKVEYATGKAGWVSRGAKGEYAKLVQ